MKTLLNFTLMVLVLLLTNKATAYPPAPASQAAVNAGTEPYLYVTPKTLANSSFSASNTMLYRLSIFQSGYGTNVGLYTNGVWFWQGTTPTNLTLTQNAPVFMDTNQVYNCTVRDPAIFYYGGTYYLTWSHYGNGTIPTEGAGVATSPDGYTFTFLGYANLTNSYHPIGTKSAWSPQYFVNSTNGLGMLVSMGTPTGSTPTNYFVADVNPTNVLQLSNFRWLNITNWSDSGTHWGGGRMLYSGGLYYFFSQSGNEYINPALQTYGWTWIYPTNAAVSGGALPGGPVSVITFQGVTYLIGTSIGASGMPYLIATNQLNYWYPDQNDPNQAGETYFVPQPSSATASGDGTMVPIPVANTATGFGLTPQNYLAATGKSPLDGSGLTNLNLANVSSPYYFRFNTAYDETGNDNSWFGLMPAALDAIGFFYASEANTVLQNNGRFSIPPAYINGTQTNWIVDLRIGSTNAATWTGLFNYYVMTNGCQLQRDNWTLTFTTPATNCFRDYLFTNSIHPSWTNSLWDGISLFNFSPGTPNTNIWFFSGSVKIY